MSSEPRTRSTRGSQAGFSVLELLVVVGIVAVIAAIAAASVIASRRSADFQQTLDLIVKDVERARTEAVKRSANQAYALSSVQQYGTTGTVTLGSTSDVPPGFTSVQSVTLAGSTGHIVDSEPPNVAFVVQGAGGATGAVTITRSGIVKVLIKQSNGTWGQR